MQDLPPPSPAPGDPCVQSLGASAGTAEELYPKLKSCLSVAGPIPGTSTYEESSLSPVSQRRKKRHGWPTVHRLPGAKSSSDHPRTLPLNSSAANRPLTPDLWIHLSRPALCEGWGTPRSFASVNAVSTDAWLTPGEPGLCNGLGSQPLAWPPWRSGSRMSWLPSSLSTTPPGWCLCATRRWALSSA